MKIVYEGSYTPRPPVTMVSDNDTNDLGHVKVTEVKKRPKKVM